jgi:hypothetical protein
MHTNVFGNFGFIIMGDIQHVCDVGVFKTNIDNIDGLPPNFWMEKIKCYELNQVMCQSDEEFINILN